MNDKSKKPPVASSYTRQLLAVIDRYEADTGDKSGDLHEVAAWAYRKDLVLPPQRDVVRQIARDMARASRQDYIQDDNGEPVRRRHNYRESRGGEQFTFWFRIEEATPQKMKLSVQRRRNGTLMDVMQLHRDITYYNKNYNPGDPLAFEANFTFDIEERSQPNEYPDEPPEGDDENGSPVPA